MEKRAKLLKTEGFNQLVEGRDGYFLYNIHDAYIGFSIQRYGEYSGLEAQFLEQLYGSADIVIEAGANIGAHTVGIAKRVGPEGLVIAFEAQRMVFQTLCANIALNSLPNVECNWAALDATPGTVIVPELDFSHYANFGGVSLIGAEQGSQVRSVILDDYLWLPKLRLIKIDVEGMEINVIKGAQRLIEKFKPFLYVENDRPESSEELMRLIQSMGYRMYWHTPMHFNSDNFYGERENVFASMASWNMFCAHTDVQVYSKDLEKITDFSTHPYTITQALREKAARGEQP